MNPKKMNEILDVILALIAAITIFAWLYTTLRGIIKQEIELALYVREKEPTAEPFTDAQLEKIDDLIGDYIRDNVSVYIEN